MQTAVEWSHTGVVVIVVVFLPLPGTPDDDVINKQQRGLHTLFVEASLHLIYSESRSIRTKLRGKNSNSLNLEKFSCPLFSGRAVLAREAACTSHLPKWYHLTQRDLDAGTAPLFSDVRIKRDPQSIFVWNATRQKYTWLSSTKRVQNNKLLNKRTMEAQVLSTHWDNTTGMEIQIRWSKTSRQEAENKKIPSSRHLQKSEGWLSCFRCGSGVTFEVRGGKKSLQQAYEFVPVWRKLKTHFTRVWFDLDNIRGGNRQFQQGSVKYSAEMTLTLVPKCLTSADVPYFDCSW